MCEGCGLKRPEYGLASEGKKRLLLLCARNSEFGVLGGASEIMRNAYRR